MHKMSDREYRMELEDDKVVALIQECAADLGPDFVGYKVFIEECMPYCRNTGELEPGSFVLHVVAQAKEASNHCCKNESITVEVRPDTQEGFEPMYERAKTLISMLEALNTPQGVVTSFPEHMLAERVPFMKLTELAQAFANQNSDVIESPELAWVSYDYEVSRWSFKFKVNPENRAGIEALFSRYDPNGKFELEDETSRSGFIELPVSISREILLSMNVVAYPIGEIRLCVDGDLLLFPKDGNVIWGLLV